MLKGHHAHRGWNQRGEEKTSKCLIAFYLREQKSLVIIAVGWWKPLVGFTTVNPSFRAPGHWNAEGPGHRGAETPKVQSLQGTRGAGDEGQGVSQAAEALAVPIASHDPL